MEPSTAGLVVGVQPDSTHEALCRLDVLSEIFCRLPSLSDLVHTCLVSRSWLAASQEEWIWRHLYVREYGQPHAWELCSSFREQYARRAGLRWPSRAPPLAPGGPAPDGKLEDYDKVFGIQTLAMSYDPDTQLLLRAVRSPFLLGAHVAVQRIPLGGVGQQRPAGPELGKDGVPEAAVAAAAATAAGGGSHMPAGDACLETVADKGLGEEGALEQAGIEAAVRTSSTDKAEDAEGASAPASGSAAPPSVVSEGHNPSTPNSTAVPNADAPGVPRENVAPKRGPKPIDPWICVLSPDGSQPPRSPSVNVQHEEYKDDDGDSSEGGNAEGIKAAAGEPAAPAAAPAGPPPFWQTVEGAAQLKALEELLPTVMCSAGGLLYMPAGPTGRGLAVWDLHELGQTLDPPSDADKRCTAAAQQQPGECCQQHRQTQDQKQAPSPYWLVPEAHPGRLLAATADGGLAASGCDSGRLKFWRSRRRRALGSADISHLTRLPVMAAFPTPAARPGAGRHRLRLALCEGSGIAALLLASPLSPVVYVYRAVPLSSADAEAAGSHNGENSGALDGEGGGKGGVGQLLTSLTFGGAPGDGLALFRGCLLSMSVLCSDVMGARFGGSGGSSVLVTITVRVWKVPGTDPQVDGEDGAGPAGDGGLPGAAAAPGDSASDGSDWGRCVQLFSSRLQLEHPRSLVMGRMRPLLAASEDLLLLTAPRGVGGRPPHHQLLALECPFGRKLRTDPGFTEGRGRAMVVPEEDRLPWTEVIEDAEEVIVAVVPTPRHLALLAEDGRLRLYGIMP